MTCHWHFFNNFGRHLEPPAQFASHVSWSVWHGVHSNCIKASIFKLELWLAFLHTHRKKKYIYNYIYNYIHTHIYIYRPQKGWNSRIIYIYIYVIYIYIYRYILFVCPIYIYIIYINMCIYIYIHLERDSNRRPFSLFGDYIFTWPNFRAIATSAIWIVWSISSELSLGNSNLAPGIPSPKTGSGGKKYRTLLSLPT